MTEQFNPRKTRGIVAARADGSGSSPEIKALADDLKATWEQFKAANEERFKQLEKGFEDVVTAEKVEKINSELTDLAGKVDTALADVANLQVGGAANDPEAAAKALKAAQTFFAGKKGVESERVDEADVERYQAYVEQFPHFLRGGQTALNKPEVQAAMSVGSDPDGGYWVPTQMQSEIIRKLFETSPMRQISDVISITTDSIEWPNDTNDATSGGWVGEYESRPETATPQVGTQTIYVREQYAMPQVTQKLLDMATIDVESWLGGKIADKLAREENKAFVSGAGSNKPRGFLDYKDASVTTNDDTRAWGVLQHVTSGASAGFPTVSGSSASDPDKLLDLISKLKPAYRQGAVFVMNRAAEAAIRKLKDADGRYFVDFGNINAGATGFSLFGFPIVTAEDMPDIGSDTFSLAFGNFRVGYQIVDGRGLRVLRDNLTTKGKVKFYTTKWTGGDVINFDAIKLMKFAA